jgi:hypothetical protein
MYAGAQPMEDKSYLQALHERQYRLSVDFLDTLGQMLVHRTTVAEASLAIQDEHLREVIKNTLLTGQIIALLALMKDMGLLEASQYDEFTAYLLQKPRHASFINLGNKGDGKTLLDEGSMWL